MNWENIHPDDFKKPENDGRPVTEVDLLDACNGMICTVHGKDPRDDAVIVGAIVIGVYQIGDGSKTMLAHAPIGGVNHWMQIGIHDELLLKLRNGAGSVEL